MDNQLVQMQGSSLRLLAQMIYDFCGIHYLDNLPGLASKISRRLSALDMSCWEYTEYLRQATREWDILVEHITINETYFFREEGHLNELRDSIINLYKNSQGLKIWSAACSTGEEPYSIGMTMADCGKLPLESINIMASDINRKVLGIAEKGWYHKNSLCFRRTTPEQLEKFFDKEGDGYEVKSHIKDLVEYRQINLLDEKQVELVGEVDMIFCRNVLIYFDSATVKKILTRFYSLLKPGGFLFLGHAETIRGMNGFFETINAQTTFYYKKGITI